MYKVTLRKSSKEKRKLRVRKKVSGTAEKPRLSVFRSSKYIYAQLIDDTTGTTLVDVSNVTRALHKNVTRTRAAFAVGVELAKRALQKNIDTTVFDKGSYKYHGRVKSLAEGAREGGLKF